MRRQNLSTLVRTPSNISEVGIVHKGDNLVECLVRLEPGVGWRRRKPGQEREQRGVWQHAQRNEGEPRRRPQLGPGRAPRVERHRAQPQQRRVSLAQLHRADEQQLVMWALLMPS